MLIQNIAWYRYTVELHLYKLNMRQIIHIAVKFV